MRVSLDANILVYALQADERRHLTARDVVGRAIGGDCIQTLQSMAECFNVLVRKRHFEPLAAKEQVETNTVDQFSGQPLGLPDAATRGVNS